MYSTHTPTALEKFLKQHWFPLLLVVLVTIIGLIGSDFALWLRYDRNAILAGEYWRVLSGHFVHLTWSHLGMNAAGLVLIWMLFAKVLSVKQWSIVLLGSCLITSAGLLLLNDKLFWYVGLSGALHGLFVAGCIADMRLRRFDGKLLLVAVSAKLVWEQISGPLPGSESTAGGKVIVDAHLYGAVGGLFIVILLLLPAFLAHQSKRLNARRATQQQKPHGKQKSPLR